MPGHSRIALLAPAIALAVALGGCGGQDSAAKNEYVKQLNGAQTRYADIATEVTQEITKTSSPRQDRRVYDRYLDAIATIVGTLRAIKAPDDVRTEHLRFVAVLTDLREEVSQIVAKMRSPTTHVLAEVQRQLSAATITFNARMSSATDAINAKLRAG